MKIEYSKKIRSIVFDCDGVILNSNKIKSDCFRKTIQPFGDMPLEAFMKFHNDNPGLSRYEKFSYFLKNIVSYSPCNISLNSLVNTFSSYVFEELLFSEICDGLQDLRNAFFNMTWIVVSSSDEAELKTIFKLKDIDYFFDGGIYGSPKNKVSIIKDLLKSGIINEPILILGDSVSDYYTSINFNSLFIFVSQWTELSNYSSFCKEKNIFMIREPKDLLRFVDYF